MSTVRTWLATAMAAVALMGTAAAAQAYPDVAVSIDVDATVCSGAPVPVVVDAGGSDADIAVSFAGTTRRGADRRTFSTTFVAPTVTRATTRSLRATATYADRSTRTASTVVAIRPCAGVGDGVAATAGADDNGALPNTGGIAAWLLVVGLGLVLVGGGVTVLQLRD